MVNTLAWCEKCSNKLRFCSSDSDGALSGAFTTTTNRQSSSSSSARRRLRLLSERYATEPFIQVLEQTQAFGDGFLNPTSCNHTNIIEIMVFNNDEQLLLVARYDNLGKGAAGAAVQNLNLMLGVNETQSL